MSENETVAEKAAETPETPEQPGHVTFTTKASQAEGARSIDITWNIGKDINEAIEIFGAEVVYGMFAKALIVAAQANVRRMLGATKKDSAELAHSDDDIRNFVLTQYKPGVRAAGSGGGTKQMEILLQKLAKMKPEESRALLAAAGLNLG